MRKVTRFRTLFETLLIVLVSVSVKADNILSVSDASDEYQLSPYLSVWEDKTEDLTLEDIQSGNIEAVHRSDPEITPNFGLTDTSYWVSFDLEGKRSHEWLLEYTFSGMDRIDLFYRDDENKLVHKAAGQGLPFNNRDRDFRNVTFVVPVTEKFVRTFYLKVQNAGSMVIPLTLRTPKNFSKRVSLDLTIKGVVGGFILAMIIYNIFIAVSVRAASYVYYILFQVVALFTLAIANGVAHQYLWPNNPPQTSWDLDLALMLMLLFPILFFQSFLDTKHLSPRLHRFLSAMIVVQIVLAVAVPFLGDILVTKETIIFLSMNFIQVSLLVFSAWFAIKGNRDAQYFMAGWICMALGFAGDILWRQGLGQYQIFMDNFDEIGVALEAAILSLGLTHRISSLRIEKQAAEKELLAERETTIKTLKEADAMKDTFVANVSHELRTPLTGMIGLTDLVIEKDKNNISPAALQNLIMIRQSSRRLSNLINDIVDISSIKRDILSLSISAVDINDSIEVVVALCNPLIGNKPLVIENLVPKSLPLVAADDERIQQVLFNLVSNAIKFTENGRITLSGSVEQGYVKLHVRDTGAGVAEEDQERIFNAFEQASIDQGGTGLGLSISRKLLDLQNGSLTLTSEPGVGSCFTLTIPLADENLQQADKKPGNTISQDNLVGLPQWDSKGISPRANFRLVLLVDDEPSNLHLLRQQLEDHYQLISASSGEEALAILAQHKPDLVILDLMMPGLNGYDVCKNIREQETLIDLPILVLTAKNRLEDLVEVLRCGANDYLTKPFYKEELLARIDNQMRLLESMEAREDFEDGQLETHDTDKANSNESAAENFSETLVDLIQNTVYCWEKSTGKSLIELAEASGIWRVNMDGSRQRARSLERYLSLELLPRKPRWRNVTRTAHFVLSQDDLDEESQSELKTLLNKTLKMAQLQSGH